MKPNWQRELTTALLPRFRELGARMADGARADCPVDKSPDRLPGKHLINTIYFEVRNDGTIILGASAPYALYVECGTAPHPIDSHGPWPLRSRSGQVFGQHVNHPGTRAQPFLRPQLFRRWSMR
jgi:hypothetical protein